MRLLILTISVVSLLAGLGTVQRTDAAFLHGRVWVNAAAQDHLTTQLPNGVILRPLDECPVKAIGNVTCFDLVVPERRDAPNSRSIIVRVAVLHASDEGHKPDPYVFLMGGQGQGYSILEQIARLPDLLQRDVIILEQRGTQLAVPFFGCPNVESGLIGIDQNLVSEPSSADPAQIKLCEAEIRRNRIDKDGYDTEASAEDLWDLKQLMSIDQWNLYGVSYGGRTAESFLRKHPNAARCLILDSNQVTGIPFLFGYGRLKKLDKFFSTCAAAPGCSHFGNLKSAFERTVARLDSKPVPILVAGQPQVLTARAYTRIVTWILYTMPETAVCELPAAIVTADEDEDYAPLLALEGRFADLLPFPPPQPGDYPFALGGHIAQQTQVICAEEYPPIVWPDTNITLPFPEGWTPAVRQVQEFEQQAQAEVCRQWDFKPSNPEQGQLPPVSHVPTLVVHGAHDTIAPSEDDELLGRSYPNSTIVVFPWTGHAIIERRQGCFLPMLKSFVDSPTPPVDTSCAAQIREPEWLPSSRQVNQTESYLPMMRNVAANQVKDFRFPGRTVYISLQEANISGTVAVGLADPTTGRQLTGREPSRMASMTKTYTAAAVLRLMEMGKIDLSEDIAQYLTKETLVLLSSGGYTPDNITVRQLLQHTSGVPDFADDAYKQQIIKDPQHQWTRREQVQWAMDHSKPSGAPPGEAYAYSDTGYVLLGEIIEHVSGMPQAPAYRHLLGFDQLGLQHTWFETLEPTPTDLPPRAHQYAGSVDSTHFNPSFDLFGGGGLVSTVADEAAFLRALMTGHVFHNHADTLSTMLAVPATNLAPANGPGAGYAMGIYSIVVDDGNQTCWGHTGFWGTSFFHCPSADVTFAADRYQNVEPATDYDAFEILTTALRINRLALHPATPIEPNISGQMSWVAAQRLQI